MLLPPACPVCMRAAPTVPCAECIAALRPAVEDGGVSGLDRFRALLAYEGESARFAAALKYGRARVALPWMAASLVAVMAAAPAWPTATLDVVTWVPTTAPRRRRRGFDQSRLLARALSRSLGLPAVAALHRGGGPAQTGRSAEERQAGPRLLGDHRAEVRLRRATVLLVDDVVTTGASMRAAATELRAMGAAEIWGLALARTPLKTARPKVDRVEKPTGATP